MAEKINIATKSGGDTLTSGELNNIVSTTNAAIEEQNQTKSTHATAIETKVDKVEGKGLSTEDYTTEEKSKLDGISCEIIEWGNGEEKPTINDEIISGEFIEGCKHVVYKYALANDKKAVVILPINSLLPNFAAPEEVDKSICLLSIHGEKIIIGFTNSSEIIITDLHGTVLNTFSLGEESVTPKSIIKKDDYFYVGHAKGFSKIQYDGIISNIYMPGSSTYIFHEFSNGDFLVRVSSGYSGYLRRIDSSGNILVVYDKLKVVSTPINCLLVIDENTAYGQYYVDDGDDRIYHLMKFNLTNGSIINDVVIDSVLSNFLATDTYVIVRLNSTGNLLKFNSDLILDENFSLYSQNKFDSIYDLKAAPNGNVIIAGFNNTDSEWYASIINASGELITEIPKPIDEYCYANLIVPLSDGFFLAGSYDQWGDNPQFVKKFLYDGNEDKSTISQYYYRTLFDELFDILNSPQSGTTGSLLYFNGDKIIGEIPTPTQPSTLKHSGVEGELPYWEADA